MRIVVTHQRILFAAFFMLASHLSFAQIDRSGGSFKIPAVPDTLKAPQPQPPDSKNNPLKLPATTLPKPIGPAANSGTSPEAPGSGSSGFYMLKKEEFADAGQRYTQMMNQRETDRKSDRSTKPAHQTDQDLGTYRSGSQNVRIMCRDHQYIDGDRVSILVNDRVVEPDLLLGESFTGFNLKLEKGFNKISFKALNQGSSGPNTAQFVIYDDAGNIVSASEWNLLIGVKANLVIIKED